MDILYYQQVWILKLRYFVKFIQKNNLNCFKIWDVYNNQKCVRTYMGHTQGVRDICFTNDGRKFLSASYDRNICLWDTETGQCLSVFCNGKIPYCIKFHPERDKQHYFLAGYSDKKIVQVIFLMKYFINYFSGILIVVK